MNSFSEMNRRLITLKIGILAANYYMFISTPTLTTDKLKLYAYQFLHDKTRVLSSACIQHECTFTCHPQWHIFTSHCFGVPTTNSIINPWGWNVEWSVASICAVECAIWTGWCARLITSILAVTVIVIHMGKWYGLASVETCEVLVRGIQWRFWQVKKLKLETKNERDWYASADKH